MDGVIFGHNSPPRSLSQAMNTCAYSIISRTVRGTRPKRSGFTIGVCDHSDTSAERIPNHTESVPRGTQSSYCVPVSGSVQSTPNATGLEVFTSFTTRSVPCPSTDRTARGRSCAAAPETSHNDRTTPHAPAVGPGAPGTARTTPRPAHNRGRTSQKHAYTLIRIPSTVGNINATVVSSSTPCENCSVTFVTPPLDRLVPRAQNQRWNTGPPAHVCACTMHASHERLTAAGRDQRASESSRLRRALFEHRRA